MSRGVLRLLARLHLRGFHAAVLAALVVMPTVTVTGYLTSPADRDLAEAPAGSDALRPTFDAAVGSS